MQTFINKKAIDIPQTLHSMQLLKFLREEMNLTGVKNGCNKGVCGACTVLINNIAKRSCILKVEDIIGKDVITIEGLSEGNELHPLQKSFLDNDAVQCGFCTPGMILTAHALLLSNNNPSEKEVKEALKNNLCRCTGYVQIIKSVLDARKFYK